MVRAIVKTARPRQWVKNVLVFAAPGAAGVLTHSREFGRTMVAFGLFCLVASGTYFMNDIVDAERDRSHPHKRARPIASGELAIPLSVGLAAVMMAVPIVVAALTGFGKLAIVLGVYVGISSSYSAWLKHQAIFDIAAVASGFVLRAIAGGVAAGVPLSDWFLIVASAGSLLMVSGKRHAEFVELGEDAAEHRPILNEYSIPFLRYIRSVSSSVALGAYFLWAFERANGAQPGAAVTEVARTSHGALWFELSIVPFALAILRYALLLDAGKGGAPEEVVLSDRTLQVLGVALVGLFALGLYA